MTPEAQRIAIAEACGWKAVRGKTDKGYPLLLVPKNETISWVNARTIPDFLNDLNAMHRAEQCLNGTQQGMYAAELDNLAFTNLHEDFAIIHATAAQRAEAFLKTIGKWKDE